MDKTNQKQEMKTSNYIGLLVAITILVILVGGLAVKSLGASFLLNQRIITKKNVAQKTLAADVVSAQAVTGQYQALGEQSKLISDALPNGVDIPGLANAIEAMATSSGAQLSDVSSSGAAATTTPSTTTPSATTSTAATVTSSTAPTPLPISISASVSYANLPRFLSSIEGSLRPITISDIQLSGTNAKLIITITATTYYQNPVTFTVTKETVK